MSQHPGDETLMMRALALAERARGLTSPNPLVGALVVKDGVVVGEGYHARAGAPHAERVALTAGGPRARGAALSQAGLEVSVGCLEAEARRLNRAFFTWVTERRPFITLKVAMSLDGKISSWNRASRWITGEEARREAHRLRSEADAIVVGIGTVLADDPELTVRLDPPWQGGPYRVIVDSQARTPASAPVLFAGSPGRTLIAVTESADAERVTALGQRGVQVLTLPARDGRADLTALAAELARRAGTA